jgi:sigma-B regulation protein RsbU (phosphoserine phosphatase)
MSHDANQKTADHIQRLFVGEDGKNVRGLRASSLYQPLDPTGGDLWILDPVGKTDAFLVFGDVTGHGEAAGMVTAVAAGAVEMARLGMGNALQPFMLANLLTHVLLKCAAGEFLISGLVGRYQPESRVLSLVNAGHPPPRLVRGADVKSLRGDGHPPLGGARTHRYSEQQVQLQKGDILVLFSDGFSEALSASGEEFGERRIQALCEEHAADGAEAIREAIHAALIHHIRGGPGLEDDLTLLLLTVD